MTTNKELKISVSPIIYNNGNRKIALKINDKEVYYMQDNFIINDELKNLILSDEKLKEKFLISLLHTIYKNDDPKTHDIYTIDEYEAIKSYINDNLDLKNSLSDTLKDILSNDVIDDVIKDYDDLETDEAKQVIYTLARVLYMQDKYKDDKIGNEIDTKIKEWLEYIRHYDNDAIQKVIDPNNKKVNTKEYEKALNKMSARVFYHHIPLVNFIISTTYKNRHFMSLWNYDVIKMTDLHEFITNGIENKLTDSTTSKRYSDKLADFINSIENNINMANFERDKKRDIKAIKDKYKDKDGLTPQNAIDPLIEELAQELYRYEETNGFKIQDMLDIEAWRDKANKFIDHLRDNSDMANKDIFNMDYTLNHLAFNEYQRKEYKLNIDDENALKQDTKKDNQLLQATSKQLKAIDNARGGLVTYNESDAQAIKNELKEKHESLKNTHIKQDKERLSKEIEKLNQDLIIAEKKEKELKDEYKKVCDYLENIYKSMANEPKTSSYYKDLKRAKKQQEQRKKELERVIRFNGWQLDLWGNGSYTLDLNKRNKESLKLTIENLSKQIAKYTKEEQDIFDFLISKYLHNTDIKEIKFTLREYEDTKKRVRPTNYLMGDIQAIRLLFREVWTYYTTNDKTYTFNEEHLFTKLNIKGELESDLNNLNNANLDTEISLEPTETLQKLLQDHDNYLYISTSLEIMQLNNDNEYLAKRLLKYLNYLARVNKKSVLTISLDAIIEELQHYGLKRYNMLDRHKTFKTEIVDVIDKQLSLLEGDNHLEKRFIEVLDRQPFINYDNDYRGKSQETSINEWGKQKIKVKVYDLDDTKLLETKTKQTKNKKRATKNK